VKSEEGGVRRERVRRMERGEGYNIQYH